MTDPDGSEPPRVDRATEPELGTPAQGDIPGLAAPAAVVPAVAAPLSPPLPRTPGSGTIRRLLLLAGLGGLVLGAAAVRHAVLLQDRIDPDLITTPDAALAETVATAARIVLVLLLVGLARTVPRWLRGVRATLQALWPRGVVGTVVAGVDGRAERCPTPDDPRLLTAAVPLLTPRAWWETGVADGTRSARLAVAVGGIALGMVAAGSLATLVVGSRDVASIAWAITGVGGFLLAPAAALLAAMVSDIDRREAAAINAVWPGRTVPDAEHRWAAAAIAALIAVALAAPAANVSLGFGERTCPVTDLECRWIVVQADQLSPDPRGATTALQYGVWRATGERRGTIVLATGGPGVSGLAAWATAYRSIDPRLTRAYDVVIFDARGVGGSGFLDCPVANGGYWEGMSFEATGSVISAYVDGCLAETAVDTGALATYASAQVAEDIDTIRADLGLERIVLYGESYGTAVAQRYALAHPDRLEALILDGALDINQPTDAFWREATGAFEDVLERTFAACVDDEWCHDDLPDPARAWDRVLGRLAEGPVEARYADPSGQVVAWEVDEASAISVLGDALYDELGRAFVLQAIAAADQDDWIPLARLIHAGTWGIAYYDTSASDFAYHATWCADRVVDPAGAADPDAYLRAARGSGLAEARLGSVYLSGAACHAWPLGAPPAPPEELPDDIDFPVFVLTATGDPITPPSMGARVADRYDDRTDVYRIETTDGPHVTFGRGATCPDDAVVDFLVDGDRPLTRTMRCPGSLVSDYTGLVSQGDDEHRASYLARALDVELLVHPDYLGWDGTTELSIGCRLGGVLLISRRVDTDHIEVEDCEVVPGDPMAGTGSYDDDGSVHWDVTGPDGTFRYSIGPSGRWTLEGTYDGRRLDESG